MYSVRIDEFTVLRRAGMEKKDKEPLATDLNRRDLDYHPNLRYPNFVFVITPNLLLFHHRGFYGTRFRHIRYLEGALILRIRSWSFPNLPLEEMV